MSIFAGLVPCYTFSPKIIIMSVTERKSKSGVEFTFWFPRSNDIIADYARTFRYLVRVDLKQTADLLLLNSRAILYIRRSDLIKHSQRSLPAGGTSSKEASACEPPPEIGFGRKALACGYEGDDFSTSQGAQIFNHCDLCLGRRHKSSSWW